MNKTPSAANGGQPGFRAYLATQKKMILAASVISAAMFIILKLCFPYPDLFVDSTNYVIWAYLKFDVAYRPTGYSYFLRFTHAILHAALLTVFVQYLLFFLSTLFCFFSADYLFGLPQKLKWSLLLFLLIDPLLVLQTNLISSDSLFCSLTVIWFTVCLWIVCIAGWRALALQLLLLYCCIEVRYASLFFPLVAVVVFIISGAKWRYKVIGIALTLSVVFLTVERQKYLNWKETHCKIFSAFEGWQIANNALYCYKHIKVDINDLPSVHCQHLDRLVNHYIDSMKSPMDNIGPAFIWDNRSPLKIYCIEVEHIAHINYFVSWFAISIPLHQYGWYIVSHFPREFLRYYILPNTANYFYPLPEAVGNYHTDFVLPPETKEWFDMDIENLSCRFPGLQGSMISIFPLLSLLLNVFNIGALLFFLLRWLMGRKKLSGNNLRLFAAWGLFYLAFMGFSIFASAVNLRFMDPVFVLGLIIPLVLLRSDTEPQTRTSKP
jgi:hypothetical protein